MKIKKIIKRLLEAGLAITTGYLTYVLIKAKSFKNSCDINKNSIDNVAILKNLTITYPKESIRDFKLGCFLGTLSCNLKNFIFEQPYIDLTICIEQGIMTLYVPDSVNLIITSNNSKTDHVLNFHRNNPDNKHFIIINTNIHFGHLIIRSCN